MDLTYVRFVMGTCFRESRTVVNLAKIWVTTDAEARCHVVRKMARFGQLHFRYLKIRVLRNSVASLVYQAFEKNMTFNILNSLLSKIHLLNKITPELSAIQALSSVRRPFAVCEEMAIFTKYKPLGAAMALPEYRTFRLRCLVILTNWREEEEAQPAQAFRLGCLSPC